MSLPKIFYNNFNTLKTLRNVSAEIIINCYK